MSLLMDIACIQLFICQVSRPSWTRRQRACVRPRGSFCRWRTLSICQIRTLILSIEHLSRRLATSTLGSKINCTHYLKSKDTSYSCSIPSRFFNGCLGGEKTAEEHALNLSSFYTCDNSVIC